MLCKGSRALASKLIARKGSKTLKKATDLHATKKKISLRELEILAEDLAKRVEGSDIITLSGDLGAGKTSFVQFFARSMGVKERVLSPTFNLYEEYIVSQDLLLAHFDLYRIENSWEAENLEWQEIWGVKKYISVIEWPEKLADLIPKPRLEIILAHPEDYSDEYRNISIQFSPA